LHEPFQGARQAGRGSIEFFAMGKGQPSEERAAGAGQLNDDFAAILAAVDSRDGAASFETVHQLDGAVMFELEAGGEFTDGGPASLRQATDGEEELVLLGLDAAGARLLLAEMKKTADLAAEFRQGAVFLGRQVFHINIVTRYNYE